MKCEKLQPIEYGRIPNVLLMGNGINVSFGGSSWNQVLAGLSTGEFTYDHESISRLPYALQTIVVSSDSVSDGLREVSKGLMPKPLSEEHGDLLRKYISEFNVLSPPRKLESFILSLIVRPVFESYFGPGIAKR